MTENRITTGPLTIVEPARRPPRKKARKLDEIREDMNRYIDSYRMARGMAPECITLSESDYEAITGEKDPMGIRLYLGNFRGVRLRVEARTRSNTASSLTEP